MITRCWLCGAVHTAASAIAEGSVIGPEPVPSDGDSTLCVSCGSWGIFAANTIDGLREPTPAEARQIRRNKLCQLTAEAWLQVRARKQ